MVLAQVRQAVIKYSNHLISYGFIDVAKPILYAVPCDFLHHALVCDASFDTSWYLMRIFWIVIMPSKVMILCPMAGKIGNMNEDLQNIIFA